MRDKTIVLIIIFVALINISLTIIMAIKNGDYSGFSAYFLSSLFVGAIYMIIKVIKY